MSDPVDAIDAAAYAYGALLAEALHVDPMLVERAAEHLERHAEVPGYSAAALLLRSDLSLYREGKRS